MTIDDLRLVLDWAAEEGWNPGLDDAGAFLATDPQGFFVAVEDDRPVAAISVVNHSDGFAFLGLYICRPAWRGRGIGHALWQEAIAHAGTRTIGLDGVPGQQANYARSGFTRVAETRRYVGEVAGMEDDGIRPATPGDIPTLVGIEARASGWAKAPYLTAWFTDTPHRRTLVAGPAQDPTGVVTVRACREGVKIGPLWARNDTVAQALIAQAATCFGGPVTVDVPSDSRDLDRLCNRLNMTCSFGTARMYRGPVRAGEAGVFAPATLELG